MLIMNAVWKCKVHARCLLSSHINPLVLSAASLPGDAEKWVSMETVPSARALACVHACQRSYKVFSSEAEVSRAEVIN